MTTTQKILKENPNMDNVEVKDKEVAIWTGDVMKVYVFIHREVANAVYNKIKQIID